MIKLAILLVIGVVAKQAYCDEPEAIVGGDFAEKGQFPYQVSLQLYEEHICGGSIISNREILTAAHCVENQDKNDLTIVTGTTAPTLGGNRHKIKCIQMHSDYTGLKEDGWKNDIALITLAEPIQFNNLQKSIPLASKNHIQGSKRGIVSGWGKTEVGGPSSPVLKWVSMNVLSQERCLHGHKNPKTNEKHICALEKIGKGACQGDSGGPLVVDNELVGVVSWVLPCALGRSDVFTNVYYYRDFIKQAQSMC